MGYEIADACARQGAQVILISGPVSVTPVVPGINLIRVQTAEEMYHACKKYFPSCDAAVLAAAVADFTPEFTYSDKVKREAQDLIIKLKPTRHIAAELGSMRSAGQVIAGFALETGDGLENAKNKLRKKNFDFIVLNSLKDEGAGFGTDTNRITIIDKNNNIDKFELKSKREVAADIVSKLIATMIIA